MLLVNTLLKNLRILTRLNLWFFNLCWLLSGQRNIIIYLFSSSIPFGNLIQFDGYQSDNERRNSIAWSITD